MSPTFNMESGEVVHAQVIVAKKQECNTLLLLVWWFMYKHDSHRCFHTWLLVWWFMYKHDKVADASIHVLGNVKIFSFIY